MPRYEELYCLIIVSQLPSSLLLYFPLLLIMALDPMQASPTDRDLQLSSTHNFSSDNPITMILSFSESLN